jgi:hypothetical protein
MVPGTVAVNVPLILSRPRLVSSGLTFVIAILLFVAGGAIYAWCVFDSVIFRQFERAAYKRAARVRSELILPLRAVHFATVRFKDKPTARHKCGRGLASFTR